MIETRQILEELQLKNVLATSATGAVFLAGDPDSGRDVVIKMISCAVPNAEEKVDCSSRWSKPRGRGHRSHAGFARPRSDA